MFFKDFTDQWRLIFICFYRKVFMYIVVTEAVSVKMTDLYMEKVKTEQSLCCKQKHCGEVCSIYL